MKTVCGSEFQTVDAEDRKARLEKSVLMNICPAAEWQLNVKFGCKRVLRFGGVGKPEWTCSQLCMSELPTLCDPLLNWQPMQLVQ